MTAIVSRARNFTEFSSNSFNLCVFLIASRPVNFKLRYEFVDYHQDGAPTYTEQDCHRKFVSNELERRDMGKFRSVRNIFLFGRGGAAHLK